MHDSIKASLRFGILTQLQGSLDRFWAIKDVHIRYSASAAFLPCFQAWTAGSWTGWAALGQSGSMRIQ